MTKRTAAYVVRTDTGIIAFVPMETEHPFGDKRKIYWMRTDASVVYVACPECRSAVGELCKFRPGQSADLHLHETSATHWARRRLGRNRRCQTIAVMDGLRVARKVST